MQLHCLICSCALWIVVIAVVVEGFDDGMGSVPFGDTELFDGFYGGFGGGGGHGYDEYGLGQLGASTSHVPLPLDGGTAEEVDGAAASTELLEAPKRKGDHRSEKAAMALKSHSEAERRRRERINAHLATLRTMVPCTDKVSSSSSSRHPSCS